MLHVLYIIQISALGFHTILYSLFKIQKPQKTNISRLDLNWTTRDYSILTRLDSETTKKLFKSDSINDLYAFPPSFSTLNNLKLYIIELSKNSSSRTPQMNTAAAAASINPLFSIKVCRNVWVKLPLYLFRLKRAKSDFGINHREANVVSRNQCFPNCLKEPKCVKCVINIWGNRLCSCDIITL